MDGAMEEQTLSPLNEPPSYSSVHEGTSPRSEPVVSSEHPPRDMVFEIKVSDPVKQGDGVNAHVSYRVSTNTNLPQYRWAEFSVIRRFSDLVWLRERLSERHAGSVIPPLPEKGVATKVFTISNEFIEQRRAALGLFLNRTAHHPALCFSADLQFFLEASEEAWAEQKTRVSAELAAAKKPLSMFGKMIGDLANQVVTGSSRVERAEDAEVLKVQEYYTTAAVHMADVRRQGERLVKRQGEVGAGMSGYGEAMEGLGTTEQGQLRHAFEQLGNGCFAVNKSLDVETQELADKFENPLKDATRYLKAVQEVLAAREAAWETIAVAKDDVTRLEARVHKLRGAGGNPYMDVQRSLSDAQQKVERSTEAYDSICQQMQGELSRFQDHRCKEMKSMLAELALSQARQAADTAAAWQEVIPIMDAVAAHHAYPAAVPVSANPAPADQSGTNPFEAPAPV